MTVAGKYRLPCLMAVLTGIRHGELKRLRWGDLNLSVEKPSVLVRASISKNHKQACLPLHPALLAELTEFRPVNVSAEKLVFPSLVPHPRALRAMLKNAKIAKLDSQGRAVDFHSLRHTFCTNLHKAGVPQREAMELMRHNDPRLTATTYADASLSALRSAVEKLPWNDDAQRYAQKSDFGGHLQSSAGTEESELEPANLLVKWASSRCQSRNVTDCQNQRNGASGRT